MIVRWWTHHTGKTIIPFPLNWMGYDLVTVFFLILNQMEFHLVQNRKGNCHLDHIPFTLKGNGNIVFLVHHTGKNNRRVNVVQKFIISASWDSNWGLPWNLSDNHDTIVSKDLRGALNWAALMPRDASHSDSQCGYFRVWVTQCLRFVIYQNVLTFSK